MKIKLDTAYSWKGGRTYGPGEVEVPDDLAIALGHNPKPEPEPEPKPTTTTKRRKPPDEESDA